MNFLNTDKAKLAVWPPIGGYMNYINYSNERTKAGELMSKEIPLQKIDYAHRRTDESPEYQDGTGAIFWLAVAVLCNILLVIIGVCYG